MSQPDGESLPDAVRRAVTRLGPEHLDALVAAYHGCAAYTPDALAAAREAVPAVHLADVERINRAWEMQPALPGAAIALAVESARLSFVHADRSHVEVVVTGPDSPAVPIRLTSVVVTELIAAAQSRVTIVSYSVAGIPAVLEALGEAQARGVRITLIFESPEHLDSSGIHHYTAYPIYHWPTDRRPPGALLHAKAVIVDGRDILVTSANLSNLAHQHSLELGLLCRGGGAAERVQHHFDALIATGVLTPAGP